MLPSIHFMGDMHVEFPLRCREYFFFFLFFLENRGVSRYFDKKVLYVFGSIYPNVSRRSQQ